MKVDECKALEPIISDLFDVSVVIVRLDAVTSGINKEYHVLAQTKSGDKFGLKLFDGTGSDFGGDKDKLMADLAILANMPNACRVEQTSNIEFIDKFKGKNVNVTKWLQNSQTLKYYSNDPEWARIIDLQDDTFHYQIGQWMSFGYSFSIADRNLGNWVWDANQKKLAMIDMEFAFSHEPRLADFNLILNRYVKKSDNLIRSNQLETIIKGFIQGRKQLQNKEATILNKLKDFTFTRKHALALDSDPEEIIRPFFETYWF